MRLCFIVYGKKTPGKPNEQQLILEGLKKGFKCTLRYTLKHISHTPVHNGVSITVLPTMLAS